MNIQRLTEELDVWHTLYKVPGFTSRTIIVKLKNHKLLIIGPATNCSPEFHEELQKIGTPEFLLAPNFFHHMGVKEWQKVYPKARMIASTKAMPRLLKQGYDNIETLEEISEELPDSMELLEPQGMKIGEVWLKIQDSRGVIWIICDSFFNIHKIPRGPIRYFLRLMRAIPGLRISSLLLWIGLSQRKHYRQWLLNQLKQDSPYMLVPAHGEINTNDNLCQQLQVLIEKRV